MGKSGDQACPVAMKFANFASKKTDKSDWDSEPFYSHDKGYKLLLNVWPDGHTHLSVFLYLMKGPHDDKLMWPVDDH